MKVADLYPHKSGLGLVEPVALIGQNVCVIHGNEKHYAKIEYLESLPPFQALDIGAIAAQTTSARTNAPRLELYDNEFGQFRWFPLDNAQVRMFLPQSSGRNVLRTVQIPVEPTIVERDPDLHLTEFFVWEDRTPAFEASNFSDYALTACRIICMGYRFVMKDMSSAEKAKVDSGDPCTYIVTSGYVGRIT